MKTARPLRYLCRITIARPLQALKVFQFVSRTLPCKGQ